MTRFIAFINEKGGVGKTTLAVNVAAYFASKKSRRVLLVDLDTQGHAGKSLGIDSRHVTPNMFHLLTDETLSLDDVTKSTSVKNLWMVPSWKEMSEYPQLAASDPDRTLRLRKRVSEAATDRYDYVIFDAPPSLGLVSQSILAAAEEVVVPVATTYLSLDGCAEIAATVKRVAESMPHPKLRITQVVPTLYRKTAMADEVLSTLRGYFPKRVSEPVSFNVALDEAQSHGQTIWEYAEWSRGATMLQTVSEAIDKAARY